MNRLARRIVSCLGVVLMLDIPAGLEPGRLEEGEGPGEEPESETEPRMSEFSQAKDAGFAFDTEQPHAPEEDFTPHPERREASAPLQPGGGVEQQYTLTLSSILSGGQSGQASTITVKKIAEAIAPYRDSPHWLYGLEEDLDRLQRDLQDILALPARQVSMMLEQLRLGHEITAGSDVADDAAVLSAYGPLKQTPFTLRPIDPAVPARNFIPIPTNPFFYHSHPEPWLGRFPQSELIKFGMHPNEPIVPLTFYPRT